jgi:FkbM family methyltransferase
MTQLRDSGVHVAILSLRRFLQKPLREKAKAIGFRWKSVIHSWSKDLSNARVLVRLPFGAWWIPRNDHVSQPLLNGTFEVREIAFVEQFLQPGMTVLDIGAHHGLYTLLASKRVGRMGKVFAFEPSPRERRALQMHLRINLCSNVTVQAQAVGDEDTKGILYVVENWAAGCNSLKPPDVPAKISRTSVHVVRLDDWLAESKIERVDFIKLDVEGAELAVLCGARKFLERRPRPVILVEVQDIRTAPWGYAAREIVNILEQAEYTCFQLSPNGKLLKIDAGNKEFDLNLVAVPNDRNQSVLSQINAVNRD